MRYFIVVALASVVLTGLSAWLHVDTWNECRETHSWTYCYFTVFK